MEDKTVEENIEMIVIDVMVTIEVGIDQEIGCSQEFIVVIELDMQAVVDFGSTPLNYMKNIWTCMRVYNLR